MFQVSFIVFPPRLRLYVFPDPPRKCLSGREQDYQVCSHAHSTKIHGSRKHSKKSAVMDNKNGKCCRLSLLRLVFCQLILCLHISSGIEFVRRRRESHQTLIDVDGNHTSTPRVDM